MQGNGQILLRQLELVEGLRELPFDAPAYEEWRAETGRIIEHVFGRASSEQHPYTKAFLNYRILEQMTATRDQMQEYYQNILHYQEDLLKMYLQDIQEQG